MYEDDSMQEYTDYHSEQAEANAREAADYDHENDHDEGTDGDQPEDYEPDMCDIHFGGDA